MNWRPVLLALILLCQAAVSAARPSLNDELERARRAFGVPGAVVVAVRNGRIVDRYAAGVLRQGDPAPVTTDTLFAIGSITKSFTAAAIGMLVDEGRLAWDDPAIRHLPTLRLSDEYVTSHLTLRDMLAHRSGFSSGAGDLLSWPETSLSTEEKLARLQHIPLTRGFRNRYGYSNLLYTALGQVVARRSGQSWPDFIRSRILAPLGMGRTSLSASDPRQLPIAWPHARLGGALRGIGEVTPLPRRYGLGDGAAGAIHASGDDMARWIALQLGAGAAPDGGPRLFSEAVAREMHAAQTPLRIRPSQGAFAAADPSFSAYGFGWFVRDYRGVKIVYHAGGTLGAVAQMNLIPQADTGFIILTNSEESGFLRAVELILLDHYLDLESPDWIALQLEADADDRAAALSAFSTSEAQLARGPAPLPLTAYAGRYLDPWFGAVLIEHREGRLRVAFENSPYLDGALEHVGGNLFRTRFREPGMEDAYITFETSDGRVGAASVRAVSPIADFSFDFRDLHLVRQEP